MVLTPLFQLNVSHVYSNGLERGGKNVRKRIAVLTLCVFMISILAGTAIAKNNNNYGQLKSLKSYGQRLVDIDDDWAQADIEEALLKGFVKGYADGTYQPNKPVTCLEVIVMLVRAAGLEDEVDDYDLSDDDVVILKKIPDWAKAYVAVALDEGILSSEEIKNFNPNQGAKRYQICVYMQNVLDEYNLDTDDEEFMESFIDGDLIPFKARHSVRNMARFGVVNGYPDGSFGPMRVVKRNEVAKMLNYLDDICLKNCDSSCIRGILEDIDFEVDILTLDMEAADGEDWTFNIDENEDVKIYYDGKLMPFNEDLEEDIETGGIIRVYVDSDDNPLLVKISSPEEEVDEDEIRILLGTLNEIEYDVDEEMLTLEVIDEDFELEIYDTDDVDIYYDEDKMSFDEDLEEDIETGGIVIALLNEDDEPEWIRIYLADADYNVLLGTLDDIDYDVDEEILTLEAIDEDFDLEIAEADGVEVYYEDDEVDYDEDLNEIEIGGIIVVLLDDNSDPLWVRIYPGEE